MRRRWVYVGNDAVEVSLDYRPEPPNTDAVLWNDRAYSDAGDGRFHSRTSHREYLRARGLTTADDYTQEWRKAAAARVEFFENAPDKSRAGDVARALDAVARGHRPRRVDIDAD